MLNTEQRDVLDSVLRHGSRLTIVQARAGCGKTFVLKALARAAAPRRCLYIVFDSKNAKAAQETFADIPSVTASTVHSLAYRAMDAGRQWGHKMHGASLKYSARYALMGVPSGGLGKRSMYRVAQAVEKALAAWCQSADSQVSESHVVVEREWFLDGEDRARLERGEPREDGLERRQYHQVVKILKNREDDYRRRIVEMAQRWWAQIIDPASEAPMNHDSYLKLWQLSGPVLDYDIILCDEAQDWNALNIDLVQRQKAQLVVVGDSEQAIYCQPAGTKVAVVAKRYNQRTGTPTAHQPTAIEDLAVGDVVLAYDVAKSFLRRTGCVIDAINSRHFSGDLVVVRSSQGHISKYTPNHHCIVRLGRIFTNKFVVYLMRKGNQYRIGRTSWRMDSQGGTLGIPKRARQERADGMWALSVHEAKEEATLCEYLASAKYGIPMITFVAQWNGTLGQERLDRFWGDIGDNSEQASKLLLSFGRDIRYPLWEEGTGNMLVRRASVIAACNLMTDMEVLPVEGAKDANGKRIGCNQWVPIAVSAEHYDGMVYSVSVADLHSYVADGIITHNSFRGAIDALQKMRTEHATVLHLTQSYRFGPEVAMAANSVLAAKQDMFGGDMPMVRGLASKESRIVASIPDDDPYTLICRGNATAFRAVCRGLEKGLKLHVVGGVKEIASFVSSAYWMQQRDTRGVDVDAKLISHHEIAQFDKWTEVVRAAEDSRQLAMVVKLLDENEATIMEMLDRLDGFRSTPEGRAAIVVTTAHKAKGLEWPNVRLAGDFPDQTELRPGREPSAEELNILYVAATRATDKLVVNAALDALVRKYPVRVRSAEMEEFDRAIVPDGHEWPEPPDGPCAVCGGGHYWKFSVDADWICTGCAHLDPDEPLPAEAYTATVEGVT